MVRTNWESGLNEVMVAERIERELERISANSELERIAKQASDAVKWASLLEIEKDRFRAAVSVSEGLLWTNDASGRMVGEQPGWASLTGQSQPEYQDYGWAQAVHPDDAQPTVDAWKEAVAERRTFEFEHRVRRHDGVWRIFKVRAVPLFNLDDGSLREWVGIHSDITAQRQAEVALQEDNAALEARVAVRTSELERLARHLARERDRAESASRAKTRFLAGMSHELRTPLNGILGYAQMLRLEGGLTARQRERIEAMLGAGKHLLEMITSVLDMSEIEAEHVALRLSEVDGPELMQSCLDVIGVAGETKGLALSLSVLRGAPRRITTDATRLRQVVLNLLGNAVKFTEQGGVELRLCPAAEGDAVRIEVVDTGPGVPAELRPRLFQDFERLDYGVGPKVEGSGLGLALSARLAKLLGGQIGYKDKPGGGSVFWLELPSILTDARSFGEQPSVKAPASALAIAPLHILVADDLRMNREILEGFLRTADHRVTCVEGGAEAVTAAMAADYDVILMDVRMAGVDGLEATRRIRRLPGRRGSVAIIGVTAQAFAEQVLACTAAGMDAHLPKPFTPEALLRAVATASAHGRASLVGSVRTAQSAPPVEPGATIFTALPLVDQAQISNMTVRLSATALTEALDHIVASAEALMPLLCELPTDSVALDGIVDAVHRLAGAAGLFGFPRLAHIGPRLEYAIRIGAPEVPALALSFHASIEATVDNIRRTSWKSAAACCGSALE